MILNGKAVLVKSDGSGDVVPNTEYDDIQELLYSGYYVMTRDGKPGVMSSNGTVIVDCICDEVFCPNNGVGSYRVGDKYGVFDEWGNVTLPIFDDVDGPDIDDWVRVTVGDQLGFINQDGEFTQDEEEAYWGCFDD